MMKRFHRKVKPLNSKLKPFDRSALENQKFRFPVKVPNYPCVPLSPDFSGRKICLFESNAAHSESVFVYPCILMAVVVVGPYLAPPFRSAPVSSSPAWVFPCRSPSCRSPYCSPCCLSNANQNGARGRERQMPRVGLFSMEICFVAATGGYNRDTMHGNGLQDLGGRLDCYRSYIKTSR